MLVKLIIGTIDALIYLHAYKPMIMHRDIKPDNIMLLPDKDTYKAVIIDFGSCIFTQNNFATTFTLT